METFMFFFSGSNFWKAILFLVVLNVLLVFVASRIMMLGKVWRKKNKKAGGT